MKSKGYVQKSFRFALILLISGVFIFPFECTVAKKVRHPAVAGSFYPSDPQELASMVDGFLAQAKDSRIDGQLKALVSPHAGYVFSGHVAAYSYALLRGKKIDRVVILAPCHVEAFEGASIYDGDAYETPLGLVPVDKDFSRRLAGLSDRIRLSDLGHRIVRGRGEHSLEVQLPFLQRVLRSPFKIVPIVFGEQSYETCRAVGVALAKLIRDPRTIIIASSDLSHYHPYHEAVSLDWKLLHAIEAWDYYSMSRNLATRTWEACGGGPIIAAMMASERLGANQIKVLKYANSGDVPGVPRDRVVGYAAIVMFKSAQSGQNEEEEFRLSRAEQEELMEIAKRSVYSAVKEGKILEVKEIKEPSLLQERGAFVTLKENGRLRGCIGYTAPIKPLWETVRDVARFAALQDPRFPPVRPDELNKLEFEISVLSPFRHVLDIRQIQVGKHGLLIKKGRREGILLPQVAVEEGWDRMTFLRNACLKAGLPPDAWRDEDTDIFVFTAFVFGEKGA